MGKVIPGVGLQIPLLQDSYRRAGPPRPYADNDPSIPLKKFNGAGSQFDPKLVKLVGLMQGQPTKEKNKSHLKTQSLSCIVSILLRIFSLHLFTPSKSMLGI